MRQKALIYSLSRTNWWLVVTDSLVFIDLYFVFWITVPDLVCKQRLESALRSKSRLCIKAFSRSPHEYLIYILAITHFTSPLCPLFDVTGVLYVNACICVFCVAVQAGAAGVSHWEGSYPEVLRSVSLSNCCPYIQGE